MKKGPTIERPKLVHVHLIESEKIVFKMKPLWPVWMERGRRGCKGE